MKSITLKQCAKFQEIFFHDRVYSPYEIIKNYDYFPMVILGEIGTLLNTYLKQYRSPNDYKKEIGNDCADIFICFLIYILYVQKNKQLNLLNKLDKNWNKNFVHIKNDKEFNKSILFLINKIYNLIENNNKIGNNILIIFDIIKSISLYATDKEWQNIIDDFHKFTFDKFTDFIKYTPDLWYRGSCWVDFKKLISWGKINDMFLPPKRLLFLERMMKQQKS